MMDQMAVTNIFPRMPIIFHPVVFLKRIDASLMAKTFPIWMTILVLDMTLKI